MMLSTTNPTRLPGVERPTPPLLTTSTGSQMMEEDWPQLLHQLLLSKNGFHSTTSNLRLQSMIKETMPGLILKKVILTLTVGVSILKLLVLTILTQLKIHWNFQLLLLRDKFTQ
jgi:hypothetical protein